MIEVTIALGIVSFALVAVLGTLPIALNSGRSSITQTRATALAGCLYASFRSQPYDKICYVDSQLAADGVTPAGGASPTPVNLYTEKTAIDAPGTVFYAAIVGLPGEAASTTDPRRVKYTLTPQADSTYRFILRCDNQPDAQMMPGVINRVEIAVNPLDHPTEVYKFSSVITNRAGSALGVTSS